jgi:hypothetical protein
VFIFPPGHRGAVRGQAGEPAQGRRELGDLGFPREQDLPDQPQARIPPLRLARIVEAR